MLERLMLRDFVLIEHAEVELGPGLNVVTGETGAGKSLLVQALDLILGQRAGADVVRDGARAASVHAEFRLAGAIARSAAGLLQEWGIEFDGETLIVRREVSAEGRSRAFVNDATVTLASLKRLGEVLADLHGQHEHQSLLRADAAVDALDRLAGLEPARAQYVEAHAALRETEDEQAGIEASLATVGERREWLEESARELDEAHLAPGEEDRLRDTAVRLAHGERLRELVGRAIAALAEGDGAAADALGAATHAVEQAAALDASLADVLPALEEARIAAGEAARTLADYADRLGADPAPIEEIETRRELLARLTRKHRRDVEELIAWREEIRRELALAEDGTAILAAARARRDQAEAECLAAGRSLSRQRRARARDLSTTLARLLEPLGFPKARLEFVVRVAPAATPAFHAHGLDEVELEFTPNPGEPARPLRKIASGGELSRVMLALKSALQAQDSVDVLIFDEVDSGIGGAVASAVGEQLAALARFRQILCVTHLPMIAACAHHHLRVTKQVARGRTVARIETVERDERVGEIARMLAGSRTSPTTLRQARELLLESAPR